MVTHRNRKKKQDKYGNLAKKEEMIVCNEVRTKQRYGLYENKKEIIS